MGKKKDKKNIKDGAGIHGSKDAAPLITDPRFASLHSDPRFQKMPRSRLKVAVDDRFQHMFTDKAFVDPFSIDKRGRPGRQNQKKGKHTLERYYRIGDDKDKEANETGAEEGKLAAESTRADEDENADDEGKLDTKSEDSEDESLQKNETERLEELNSSPSEASEEEYFSDSSASSSEVSYSDAELDYEEKEENVATTETETRRLGVVNMDWDHIKAADLLVLFNSFLPKGGHIESVTIYPSQFGLQQMKTEEIRGPQLFHSENGEHDNDDEGDGIDKEKLREYEKSKLRYYYAVVVCDSISTAAALYKFCDGIEFERTSNILDMRFIPDDMTFEVEPRDSASEAPPEYKAPDFQTQALQYSNVKLTWDGDEPVRVKTLRRKFNADEIDNMDYKAYLASDDDEDDVEEDEEDQSDLQHREKGKQEKIMKYKSLLLGSSDPDEGLNSKKSSVDMEITFPSGLDELSKKLLEQKDKKNQGEETVWEAYLRKKKDKKKARKKGQRSDSEEEDGAKKPQYVDADDDSFNDPFFNSDHEGIAIDSDLDDEEKVPKRSIDAQDRQKKREERNQKRKEEERNKAELELLLMDDHGVEGGVKGFNLKNKKLKGKKKGKDQDTQEADLLSTANYDDPRFASLFTSHLFAVDPTNPQFKRSAHKLRGVAELQQRKFQAGVEEPGIPVNEKSATAEEKKRKFELSSLVRSLKRKVGNASQGESRPGRNREEQIF